MSYNPLVSIITVSYQAELTIEKTIKSVLNQSYQNIEYIFKDGGSADNTNGIIMQYKDTLRSKGIDTKHIINSDTGIYNAMNQALKYCTGEWIMFLNADDYLYSNDILESIFNKQTINTDTDIIFGDTDFEDENLHFLWKGDLSIIEDNCPYCHQSSFVKRQWMISHPFDETLKITADYDFIFKSYKEMANFQYIPLIISTFKRGGASGKYLLKDRIEHRKVQLRYQDKIAQKSFKNKYLYLVKLCNAFIQEICFKVFPKRIATKIRHYRKKKRMNLIGE